ncbi:nucleotidyl transferase AbiEii/AbiGii toxin family protein [Ferrovum sp. PN-J185]|uniref:nucleotidyl transferase AbiEii/AbiGii toxin family protein n=1 Tax=Ferrovum sp. PN-J185 TaxID=1356306 RepID=UPI000795DD96|nr:nucleotidyl transferase AbiEii/AbiGii toxin family protein [Ferrovum sp. PN-J185]KXW56431.1 hypothetical protein FV185_03800 [Ferrovum sp. PN-J185]MCC6068371.1 nucleotidyl transferase AbiEii/AbiGii toxin family protein [Ferrovum sp. PN-J185]MDE1892639.1 nucleotidyl transferase AbiEii/AbiGii toxin family protein [Betaproteobacteria bacterium]MDE2057153.1 nucleotidyl transferase AbiEii/AbiGii toxin family protein [Betaproteobacteria bacterium]
MSEFFLNLETQEQSQIYRALAPKLSRSPIVLEKDVWVCWVLQALFSMPGRLPMAFKGGTSLSKVFGVIARFSEDVDITLDYRGLDSTINPFAERISKTRLKKFSEDLKSFVRDHALDIVLPYIKERLAKDFNGNAETFRLELSENGEQMRLYYPSVLETLGDYMGNNVLIEFGGRNITEPNAEHNIKPDIAPHITNLLFPNPTVTVLSPSRTFWEKVTLIHVECQRNEFRSSAERLSRHWYDLAMLADHNLGQLALENLALLADVLKYKKVFYNAGYANYDACLNGQLKLIPEETILVALRYDFQRMIDAGMFIGTWPIFDTIIDRLRILETRINERIRNHIR